MATRPIRTREVVETYRSVAHSEGVSPVSKQSVHDYLGKLAQSGITSGTEHKRWKQQEIQQRLAYTVGVSGSEWVVDVVRVGVTYRSIAGIKSCKAERCGRVFTLSAYSTGHGTGHTGQLLKVLVESGAHRHSAAHPNFLPYIIIWSNQYRSFSTADNLRF